MAKTRSEMMSRIKGRDTKPELRLRSALWAAGLRYRKHHATLAGRPDVVFPGPKVAVFIDGGFWHGCPKHYVRPRSREQFWAGKLRENIDRDRRQTLKLEAEGWKVVRIWECEVFEALAACIERVMLAVRDGISDTQRSWRVVLVVPLDDDGVEERRYMATLRDPDVMRFVDGPRVTAKWKRPG